MRTLRSAMLLGLAALAVAADGNTWTVGSTLVPFTLVDQHDRPHDVGADARLVLVSYDMDGGALVREALDANPDTLPAAGAVYVANIARMPGFVTRLFALPRMRKRPYPVLLDRDGTVTGPLVATQGHAVAVRLEGGKVVTVAPLASVAAVREALAARLTDERHSE